MLDENCYLRGHLQITYKTIHKRYIMFMKISYQNVSYFEFIFVLENRKILAFLIFIIFETRQTTATINPSWFIVGNC